MKLVRFVLTRFNKRGFLLKDESYVCQEDATPPSSIGSGLWIPYKLMEFGDVEPYDFGAHARSDFEFIGCYYLKTADRVYFESHWIEGADPDSFTPIQNHYATDTNAVYFMNLPQDDLDPVTLEFIGEKYLKDSGGVYYVSGYHRSKLAKADPNTFEFLSENYAKDIDSVFFMGGRFFTEMEHANPASFEALSGAYGADKNYIYFNEYSLYPTPDRESFEIVSDRLSRDKDHVYYEFKAVEGVDMETFEYLGGDRYRDALNEYQDGDIYDENAIAF